MRGVFAALTTRGRAFVSSGLTAIACAVVLGLDDLIRVGVLLVTLPLFSAALVVHGRQQLGLTRQVTPTRISVGGSAHVELSLSNEGRSPTGLLLLEEEVPPVLGTRPRFVVDRMGTRWRRTVAYEVGSELRGRYQLGPMRVRVDDPLGLVELDRTFHSTTSLVVTPRVVPLPAVPLGGAWTGSGDNRPKDFVGGSPEDVTVREYRRGDDLRRVHWRSSAHAGDLMVRREEQPWQSRATLFVDNRAPAHRGTGRESSLEYAVSAAASIAVHLSSRGYRVRLVTAGAGDTDRSWHDVGTVSTEAGALLESLAVLRTAARVDLDSSWLGDAHQGGLLVAVLGETFPADQPVLRRMHHGSSTAMAVALDVRSWGGRHVDPARALPSVTLLTTLGWRAVAAAQNDPIDEAWQRLGLAARRGRDLRSGALTTPGGFR